MKKFIIGICLGGIIVGSIANYGTLQYAAQVERYREQINKMGNEISQLEIANNQLMMENGQLHEQIKWTVIEDVKITYYWLGEDEFGSMTSTGVTASEGRTIAVDPELIPYGSEVMIDGHTYIAEDCGSAVKGKVIDIYVEKPHMDMYYTDVYVKE